MFEGEQFRTHTGRRQRPRAGGGTTSRKGTGGRRRHRLPEAPRAALLLDRKALQLRHAEGALEMALGDTLRRLFATGQLIRTGKAKRSDYVREFLGAKWRTAEEWMQLADGLSTRPLLKRAVVAGLVTPRKARRILAVAVGEQEGAWVHAAMTMKLADLEEALRQNGAPPAPGACGDTDFDSLVLAMTDEQQKRLDAGLEAAERVAGHGLPRWIYLECMAQEYVSSFGDVLPVSPEAAKPRAGSAAAGQATSPGDPAALAELVNRRLAALEEAGKIARGYADGVEEVPTDAIQLHRRALRLRDAHLHNEMTLGVVLCDIAETRAWKLLGFESFEAYCSDRLDLRQRTVRHRIWMERAMRRLPQIREALEARRINWTKARHLAAHATADDIEQRIAEAAKSSTLQVQDDSHEEHQRQNRARGVERLWGPADAMPIVRDAIVCARLVASRADERISEGEAQARVADHFVEVYREHAPPKPARRRREVIRRQKGRCAVPGCSNPIHHLHHVTFKSRGGSNDLDNLIGLCWFHHLIGVHKGYLTVRGRAGGVLQWRLGAIDDEGRTETWVTEGGRDVRLREWGQFARRPAATTHQPRRTEARTARLHYNRYSIR